MATVIRGPFSKEKSGKEYTVFIPDRYLKLTKPTTTALPTATAGLMILVNHCILIFGIKTTILADNGPQLTSKIFKATSVEFALTLLMIKEY